MSYWFVMAIVVIALIAVLIAITLETDEPDVETPAARSRPVWVALGSSALAPNADDEPHGESWVDLVRLEFGERIIAYDFTRFGATASEIQRDSLQPALLIRPDVVTLLIGPDDFHDAESIDVYERRLWNILSSIHQVHALSIISTLPDVTNLPSLAAEDDATQLADERATWNVATTRISSAVQADLFAFEAADEIGAPPFAESSGRFVLTPGGHQWFATQMIGRMRVLFDEPMANKSEPRNRGEVSDTVPLH